jgi:hypothetical protein
MGTSVGKSIARTWIKSSMPIGGKFVADKMFPLGSKSITEKSYKGFNTASQFNSSASNYSEEGKTRQRYEQTSKKIEAPMEDLISGGIQAVALTAAGAITGITPLMTMGVSKGISTAKKGMENRGANKKESSELDNMSDWMSIASSTLKGGLASKGSQIGESIGGPTPEQTNIGKNFNLGLKSDVPSFKAQSFDELGINGGMDKFHIATPELFKDEKDVRLSGFSL